MSEAKGAAWPRERIQAELERVEKERARLVTEHGRPEVLDKLGKVAEALRAWLGGEEG